MSRKLLALASLGMLLSTACPPPKPVPPNYACSQPADPGPIALEWPRYRMVYQQHGGYADVRVRGRLVDAASGPVIARWAKGSWQRIDVDPATGIFDGVIAHRPIGWGSVEVRIERTPELRVLVAPVGVGNVLVLAGQSNMVMLLPNLTYTLRGVTVLGQFRDPADPGSIAWAADPIHDCTQPWGSIWPTFGDRVIVGTGAPLMLVATAIPTTSLATGGWLPGGDPFEAMIRQLSTATGEQMCASALLWFQGELDAQLAIPRERYRDALIAFGQAMQDRTTCPLPILAGTIGDIARDTAIAPEAAEAIRAGTLDAIAASPHVYRGPSTFDLPISYLHFTEAARGPLLDRWCAALADAPTGLVCAP